MTGKNHRSLLALLVAVIFVFQTVPIFALPEDDAAAPTEEQGGQPDSSDADGDTVTYMIDENGDRVELGDGFDYDAVTAGQEQDEEGSALTRLDEDSFFAYDENEVEVLGAEAGEGELVQSEDFKAFSADTTEITGWNTSIVSKSGADPKSSIKTVSDSSKGMVLELEKKTNGLKNGSFNTGDDRVAAERTFTTPMEGGKYSVTADINMVKDGRLGMYVFNGYDENNLPLYTGRFYSWNNGSNSIDPAKTAPDYLQYYDAGSKADNKNYKFSVNKWYTLRFDIDMSKGTYDIYFDGAQVAKGAKLTNGISPVTGIGFEVQSDTKSLGTIRIDNFKVYDLTLVDDYKKKVAAVAAALSIANADNITENFTLPVTGDYDTAIEWTSSDDTFASIDSYGNVLIHRPEYTGAEYREVILSAVVKKGSVQSAPKNITIRIMEQSPSSDADQVLSDMNQLDFEKDFDSTGVTNDFTLPIIGQYGSAITWTSSDSNVVSIDNTSGKVTVKRPAFTGVGTVLIELTATLKKNQATQTKKLTLTVQEGEPTSDSEKALYDANNLIIGGLDLDNVRASSFYLADTASYGTVIWTSSNNNVIEIKKNLETDDDNIVTDQGGYKAEVTRPVRTAEDCKVTLTATVTVNGQSQKKSFELTVRKEDALKAYPGVEGYGAYSAGGRGGKVYHVTNLNDSGEGSLTHGLEQVEGPRTIVFDVGGVIDLTNYGEIKIKGEKYSNVTVAGQTAPYPGITLKGYGVTVSNAHDVIIRHLRIRIGDTEQDNILYQSDPLSIGNSKNVIVDHCSMQWAIDMSFRATGEYITLSNVIFGKSLLENSPHEKGGHAYVGMINEGAKKVSFIKNFVGDSTQRSPRITDADYVDAYNNLLYNCGNGFDMYNYEWMNRNSKMNIYGNYARKGPNISNATPFRAGRGRAYAGGIMVYFANNYGKSTSDGLQTSATKVENIADVVTFGKTNGNAGNPYDLSNVTLDEWNTNPLSYDNNGKKNPAATLTYMTYPFPAPRGNVLTGDKDSIMNYVKDANNGMGATKPARDLYDTMIVQEARSGAPTNATLDEATVSSFFDALEARTGRDYSAYKTSRTWRIRQGEGPVLKGAASTAGTTKPVHWDDYTDVNKNTNSNASKTYTYTTDFEVGNWWGEYCGFPGMETTYTLRNKETGRVVTTTDANYDPEKFELQSEQEGYIATTRTVADLYPASYVKKQFPEIAAFMDDYRNRKYAGKADSTPITWDGMNDGIPDWYKEYRGWDTRQVLNKMINQETGYTYLEEYLAFAAGDETLAADDTPAKVENFKVNKLGYSTAQVFWNTDYRTTCVIEYGKEPGKYTQSKPLVYTEDTDGYNTYHAVTLASLDSDTQYYYRITATDELSNVTVAEYDPDDANEKKMTFKTAIAPESAEGELPEKPTIISTVPYLNQVRLNWEGSVVTDKSYEIYYDTQSRGGNLDAYQHKMTGISADTTKQIVKGLENYQQYYFVVAAVNPNGKTASDEVVVTPTGVLFDFDFTQMTEKERKRYLTDEYMYNLGGSMTCQQDPDTGEWVLQMLDETNSHGVNTHLKLPVTQTEKFTFETKLKVVYQKQTDALNGQKNVSGDGKDEHNTFQFNFYQDAIPNSDNDSTKSALWDSAFSIFLDSSSTPLKTVGNRYDGTQETGTIKFGSTPIGTYQSGTTASKGGNRALPAGTGYSSSVYKNTTAYGDAKYSNIADTDKTLHGLWYYDKGSVDFTTIRVVIDPVQNNIEVFQNGESIYESGEFSEDLEAPLNIGKIELKSRNDGYSWVNVAYMKAYSGDGKGESTVEPVPDTEKPLPKPTQKPDNNGGGGNGGGGGNNGGGSGSGIIGGGGGPVGPVATPAPSIEPAGPSQQYFNDLAGVDWAAAAITSLYEKGIVNGVGDGLFEPLRSVTRAEYLTMLMRGYQIDTSGAAAEFTDVQPGEWYYEAVAKAANLGVVTGYPDGSFGVDATINRADMMVMTARLAESLGVVIPQKREYSEFADSAQISDYALDAVTKMYCAEIINGVGDGLLDPLGYADRAQAAKIVDGILEMEGMKHE